MDPTQMTPEVMQMLQALQGQNQQPGLGQPGLGSAQQLGGSLGNQAQAPGLGGAAGPSAYEAMMNPPPMVPPPAPIY